MFPHSGLLDAHSADEPFQIVLDWPYVWRRSHTLPLRQIDGFRIPLIKEESVPTGHCT